MIMRVSPAAHDLQPWSARTSPRSVDAHDLRCSRFNAPTRSTMPTRSNRSSRRMRVRLSSRSYTTAVSLRIGFTAASCTTIDSTEYDVDRIEVPIGTSSRLRPHHADSMYRRRLRGYPGPDYVWCELRLPGHAQSKEPDATV